MSFIGCWCDSFLLTPALSPASLFLQNAVEYLPHPPLESSHGSSLPIGLEFSAPYAEPHASSGSATIFLPQHSGAVFALFLFLHFLHSNVFSDIKSPQLQLSCD
jgi:hypothetical protein